MKPIDYIYKNLDSFNISIFKQIVEESGEEVSELTDEMGVMIRNSLLFI